MFTFVFNINCTFMNKHWALGGIGLNWSGTRDGRRSDLKRRSLSKAEEQTKQPITGIGQPGNPPLHGGDVWRDFW